MAGRGFWAPETTNPGYQQFALLDAAKQVRLMLKPLQNAAKKLLNAYKTLENFCGQGSVDFIVFKAQAGIAVFLFVLMCIPSVVTFNRAVYAVGLAPIHSICGDIYAFKFFKQTKGRTYHYIQVRGTGDDAGVYESFDIEKQPRPVYYNFTNADVGKYVCIDYSKVSSSESPNSMVALSVAGEKQYTHAEVAPWLKESTQVALVIFGVFISLVFMLLPFYIRSFYRFIHQ